MKSTAIAIPIYKKTLTPNEELSLTRCFEVLRAHSIFLFAPKDLPLENCILKENKNWEAIYFPQHWFSSIETYSALLLDKNFYSAFVGYDYMLIYQLDAFVFSDQILYWCSLDYDYIGSPWFQDFATGSNNQNLWAVGNGGFSLRKVGSFLRVLRTENKSRSSRDLFWEFRNDVDNVEPRKCIPQVKKRIGRWLNLNRMPNEDIFWGFYAKKIDPLFKVAPVDIALKFSFEKSPQVLFKRNKYKLPFGCHNWEDNIEFWKTHFQKYGYNI